MSYDYSSLFFVISPSTKNEIFWNFREFLRVFEEFLDISKKNFRAFLGEILERILGHISRIM